MCEKTSFSREYERRAEQLISASEVGRAEGVANDRLIYKANSLVFGTGTRPSKHGKRYRKLEWCSTQSRSPINTEQSARRTGTTFCYLLPILRSTRFWWPERFKGVAMAALLQLWSWRSSDFRQQFTRRAANTTFHRCFLSRLNCLQCCCYV